MLSTAEILLVPLKVQLTGACPPNSTKPWLCQSRWFWWLKAKRLRSCRMQIAVWWCVRAMLPASLMLCGSCWRTLNAGAKWAQMAVHPRQKKFDRAAIAHDFSRHLQGLIQAER